MQWWREITIQGITEDITINSMENMNNLIIFNGLSSSFWIISHHNDNKPQRQPHSGTTVDEKSGDHRSY